MLIGVGRLLAFVGMPAKNLPNKSNPEKFRLGELKILSTGIDKIYQDDRNDPTKIFDLLTCAKQSTPKWTKGANLLVCGGIDWLRAVLV